MEFSSIPSFSPSPLLSRFEFNGGEIAVSICSAAELAAKQTSGSPVITTKGLLSAGEQEVKRRQLRIQPAVLSIFQ